MATKHSKTKTFTYWRARFSPEPYTHSMQELLSLTFDNTKIKDRIHKSSDDAQYYQFINHKTERRGFFCAEMFGYEKGRIGSVIRENLDADEIEPEALILEKAADGSERQYLDGKLYFVCFENHLILVQDRTVRGRQLETYLYDRITTRNRPFRNTLQFTLERAISETFRKKISGVKRLNISSPLDYSGKDGANVQGGTEVSMRKYATGRAWDALKAFVKDQIDLTEFTTEGFVDPKDIDVTISLAWKAKKRDETESNELDAIANAFRHVENEVDIEIETKSGKFTKDQIRLSYSKNVTHYDDRPDSEDVFDKMIEWYGILNSQGQI